MTDMTNAEFIRDLAGRMFRNATPAMGFDQGDTDRLYVIANRLAALEQAGEPVAVTELDDRNEGMVCTGCGTTKTIAFIKASSPTAFTCCPERKMIPVRDAIKAAETPLPTLQRLGQEFDAGEGRCGDKGLTLCQACSLPAHELTQSPGCGAPMQKPSAWAVDDEKVEVTQADRDMAADVLFHVDDDPFVDNIREGWEDDSYLVQAFARHRASHSATAEPVGLREACATCGKGAGYYQHAPFDENHHEFAQSRGQAFDGEGEAIRGALERILSCVDANGDGCYDTVEMVAGTKQNGQIVFKGSFITECIRARAALSSAKRGEDG